jgi:hypothetical protein
MSLLKIWPEPCSALNKRESKRQKYRHVQAGDKQIAPFPLKELMMTHIKSMVLLMMVPLVTALLCWAVWVML